jgi:hypothetical protein
MTLKAFILCQLREQKHEVLHSITGLVQKELALTSKNSPHPVWWIIKHCMSVIDYIIARHINGQQFFTYPTGLSKYPMDPPNEDDLVPDSIELQTKWKELIDHVTRSLIDLDDEKLQQRSETGIEPLSESFLRVINHTNTHLRGIWCILTENNVAGKWPTQPLWMEDHNIEELKKELKKQLQGNTNGQDDIEIEMTQKYAPRILNHDNRAVLDCCEDLFENNDTNQQMIAVLIVEKVFNRLYANDFDTFERWLNQYIQSARICDAFCKKTLIPMIDRFPELASKSQKWEMSENEWVRRAFLKILGPKQERT